MALSWTANGEADLASYDVYQRAESGALSKVATVAAPLTAHTATGLANGTTYYFALKAADRSGNSSEACDEIAATPSALDGTSPVVALTQPAATVDVALTTPVTLTFSEDMDPATVTVAFAPAIVLATSDWTDGRTLVLQPSALGQNTSYALTVDGKDLAGNPLAGTKSFSFTTSNTASPEVLGTSPADGATNVPVAANIAFVFSKAMNRASVESAFGSSPAITCAWAWSVDSTLATCTHLDLAPGIPYAIALAAAAVDQAATPNHLAAAAHVAFTTASAPDTTKPVACPSSGGAAPCPTTSATAPTAGATGVSRGTNIIVRFSEPMDKASAQTAFAVVSPAGHNAGVFTWNAVGDQVVFNPDVDFAYGDAVTWRVSTAAEDLAGNTLAATFTSSFTATRHGVVTLASQAALDGSVDPTVIQCANQHASVATAGTSMNVGLDHVAPVSCSGGGWGVEDTDPRGFLSFDLASLPATLTSITSATLGVYQTAVVGDPYQALGLLRAESVCYGATLGTEAYDAPVVQTQSCHYACTTTCHMVCSAMDEVVTLGDSTSIGWKAVNVQRKVSDDWANRASRGSRSQFRLRFPPPQGLLVESATYQWYATFLTGDSATYRPYLTIAYDYP